MRSRIDRRNRRGEIGVGGRPEGAGSCFDLNRSCRVAGAKNCWGIALFRRGFLFDCRRIRLDLAAVLRTGVPAWVEGKGKQRQEEADRAKSKTD